jgi:hypothetical protein
MRGYRSVIRENGTLRILPLVMVAIMTHCLATQSLAGTIQLVHPTEPVAQGRVVQIVLKGLESDSQVEGSWRGAPLEFFSEVEGEYSSLLGVDLRLKPGTYPLEIRVIPPEGRTLDWNKTIEVVSKDYGLQKLTLPKRMVTLDAQTLKRVRKEGARFRALWPEQTQQRYWRGSFVQPVPGELSTPFGIGRIINGEPRSPHSGVDLRAPLGKPVRATNHGRIVLVGDFFFHGRAVVIDHGVGLYSMYFHLSRVDVSQGDWVGKGAIIGLVGSTGRSTGPHLHWGIRLGGARVDPFALIQTTGG